MSERDEVVWASPGGLLRVVKRDCGKGFSPIIGQVYSADKQTWSDCEYAFEAMEAFADALIDQKKRIQELEARLG